MGVDASLERMSRASEIEFAENFAKLERPSFDSRNVDSFRQNVTLPERINES